MAAGRADFRSQTVAIVFNRPRSAEVVEELLASLTLADFSSTNQPAGVYPNTSYPPTPTPTPRSAEIVE